MKTTTNKENPTPSRSSQPFFNQKGEGRFFAPATEAKQPFFAPNPSIQRSTASASLSAGHNLVSTPFSPPHAKPIVQPKLTINEPGDKYEQEADAMAERVMRMESTPSNQLNEEEQPIQTMPLAASSLQRQGLDEEGEPIQMMPLDIQKKCAGCEAKENEQMQKMPLMRKAEDGGYTASPQLSSQLSNSKGGGTPLQGNTLLSMNQAFGADFSMVRIHTDSQAQEMSQGIEAKAFTHGSDIYFSQGQYNPESKDGKKLLAHELTHVGQQKKDETIRRERVAGCDVPGRSRLQIGTEVHGIIQGWCNLQYPFCHSEVGLQNGWADLIHHRPGSTLREVGEIKPHSVLSSEDRFQSSFDQLGSYMEAYRSSRPNLHVGPMQWIPMPPQNGMTEYPPGSRRYLHVHAPLHGMYFYWCSSRRRQRDTRPEQPRVEQRWQRLIPESTRTFSATARVRLDESTGWRIIEFTRAVSRGEAIDYIWPNGTSISEPIVLHGPLRSAGFYDTWRLNPEITGRGYAETEALLSGMRPSISRGFAPQTMLSARTLESSIPQWASHQLRSAILQNQFVHGVSVNIFPPTGIWGRQIAWVSRSSGNVRVVFYQEYPGARSFYAQYSDGDSRVQRWLHEACMSFNRDMEFFVVDRGMRPTEARAEIERIWNEIVRMQIIAIVEVMTASASALSMMNSRAPALARSSQGGRLRIPSPATIGGSLRRLPVPRENRIPGAIESFQYRSTGS